MEGHQAPLLYAFGDFRLDATQRLLRSRATGEALPLTSKAFETLLHLVERRGELVEKSALMKAVWPNVVVEENNLNQCISALRRALGENANEHRYIVTVPGRGYRFVAEVTAGTSATSRAAVTPAKPRIAVLPFENLSPDPANAFFADGLHEEILTTLARRTSGLEVVSRTTMRMYRLKPKPLQEIAGELGVSHVIEGSVRREAQQVRLTLQLVDARADRNLWSRNYDRTLSDALRLQSEIAGEVAAQLSVQLVGEAQEGALTSNPLAYDFYLKGLVARQLVHPYAPIERYHEIDHLFGQAIALDPQFAAAYAQRATFRTTMFAFNYDASRAQAERIRADVATARRLAPRDSLPMASEAFYLSWVEGDLARAIAVFDQAEAVGVGDTMYLAGKGQMLLRAGRVDEALRVMGEIKALDPANPFIAGAAAAFLLVLRRPHEALRAIDQAIERFPDDLPLRLIAGSAEFAYRGQTGRWRDALERASRAAGPAVLIDQHFNVLRLEQRYADLRALLDQVPTTAVRVISGQGGSSLWSVGERPVAGYRGWTATLLGEAEEAARHGRDVLDYAAGRERTPWNDWFLRLLDAQGQLFAGNPAPAIARARESLELMPRSRDASTSLTVAMIAAAVLAWAGAEDEAVQLLERLSATTPGIGPAWVARDPLYVVPLARNSRYRVLAERLEAQLGDTDL